MGILSAIAARIGGVLVPDGTVMRNQAKNTADRLVILGVTLLAIGLAIGYQVLGRWGHRIFGEGE